MTIVENVIKELEKKYMMPFSSMIYNLSTFEECYEDEIANNDLTAVKMALEYILKITGE